MVRDVTFIILMATNVVNTSFMNAFSLSPTQPVRVPKGVVEACKASASHRHARPIRVGASDFDHSPLTQALNVECAFATDQGLPLNFFSELAPVSVLQSPVRRRGLDFFRLISRSFLCPTGVAHEASVGDPSKQWRRILRRCSERHRRLRLLVSALPFFNRLCHDTDVLLTGSLSDRPALRILQASRSYLRVRCRKAPVSGFVPRQSGLRVAATGRRVSRRRGERTMPFRCSSSADSQKLLCWVMLSSPFFWQNTVQSV